MLVGLLEAELLGCCEDMALKISTEEDDVPSEGYQSASDREKRILALGFLFRSFISSGMYRKNIELEKQVQRTELFNDGNYTPKKKLKKKELALNGSQVFIVLLSFQQNTIRCLYFVTK